MRHRRTRRVMLMTTLMVAPAFLNGCIVTELLGGLGGGGGLAGLLGAVTGGAGLGGAQTANVALAPNASISGNVPATTAPPGPI